MLLYAMVFAPFLAALLMVAASGKDAKSAARLAVIFAALMFTSGLPLLFVDGALLPEKWFIIPWVDVTVTFSFAVNGISAWMVFLANIITLAALISARKTQGGNYRNFAIGMFALQGALNGTFLADDAVLFFFFFEALVLPAAILIGSYGGQERRAAAINFSLYTLIGSAPMAVALWYLICHAGSSHIAAVSLVAQNLPDKEQAILFWCFALAFWVKTPLFPLHGWQAQTYAEAPAGLSAVLTGSMSKAGVYGFLAWVIPVFPAIAQKNATCFLWIGLFTAVYGALMAMRAKDIKKLLAFSSMGHLGLAVAGVFTLSDSMIPAVLVLLVGHGLSASALFILAGSAERFAGHRLLEKMGGFSGQHPVFAFFFGTASVLAIAIPGTAGFVGEFLVLLELWNVSAVAAVVSGICIVLTGVYMLMLIQKVLFGQAKELSDEQKKLRFPVSEALATAPLLLLLLVFGICPSAITNSVDNSYQEEQKEEELEAAIAAATASDELLTEDSTEVVLEIKTETVDSANALPESIPEVKQVEAENVR